MTNKHNKAGTGHEFLRMDLGDIGELVIKDDGDGDAYLNAFIESQSRGRMGFSTALIAYRENNGDAALEAELKNGKAKRESRSSTSSHQSGIFVCHDCHTSWPQKDNQTPHAPMDTCPDCDR